MDCSELTFKVLCVRRFVLNIRIISNNDGSIEYSDSLM